MAYSELLTLNTVQEVGEKCNDKYISQNVWVKEHYSGGKAELRHAGMKDACRAFTHCLCIRIPLLIT